MEKQRATFYRPISKNKRVKFQQEEEVAINVGITRITENGQLKPVRGKVLLVKVKKSIAAENLLQTAVKKHQAHNEIGTGPFNLLYPNNIEVKTLLEKEEPFTLEKYKLEIGKPYNRINFYLVHILDFMKFQCSDECLSDDEICSLPDDNKEIAPVGARQENEVGTDLEKEACSLQPDDFMHVPLISHFSLPSTSTATTSLSSANELTDKVLAIFPSMSSDAATSALQRSSNDITMCVDRIIREQEISPVMSYASFQYCNETPSDDDDISTVSMQSPLPPAQLKHDKSFAEALLATTNRHISKENHARIKVRRSMIWDDAKMKLRRFDADQSWAKLLKVQFVGEAAVDEGGPKREFAASVHKSVQASMLFTGKVGQRCFSNNFSALQQEEYKLYGQFCAWTLLQGCPPPSFFAPPVADFILYGSLDKVENKPECVTEPNVVNLLTRLDGLNDEKAFADAVEENLDICLDAGFAKTKVTIQDKESLLKCLTVKFTIGNSMMALCQFLDGLNLHGFLNIVREHAEEARWLFQESSCKQLTAEMIDDLYTPRYSEIGSNRRVKEESIIMNFTHFLEDVEGGEAETTVLCPETDELSSMTLKLPDILQFLTGSPSIPVFGFEANALVTFEHADVSRKLHVSTCSLELCFPVNETMLEYNSFKNDVIECIISSPGFGLV